MTTNTSDEKTTQSNEAGRPAKKTRRGNETQATEPNNTGKAQLEKNWLEWSVLGISLLLVVGIVGYLLFLEFTPANKAFRYEISFEKPEEINGRYLVPLRIDNNSNKSVQDVSVEISSGGNKSETADLQLDYLPRHSYRDATVIFDKKPTQLEGHINSFNIP
jgi:uncharacterized protein (TIGR02588 family)